MPTLREQALAPLSRADAERLLPLLSSGRQTLERRVLRARCLKYFESFDLAWAELNEVLPQVKEPLGVGTREWRKRLLSQGRHTCITP